MKLSEKMSSLGTETAFEVLAQAESLANEGRDIINLGIGQPDSSPPAQVVDAAIKALRDGHHGYTAAPGIYPIREAVAEYLAHTLRVEVSPENILVTPGGKPTIFFAIMMFGELGAEILYPNPGFPIYESVIRFSGAKPVPIPISEGNNFSFKADELLSLITPATRLIILNSPGNPAGGAACKSEMDKFVAGIDARPDIAILSDEIYSRIYYGGTEHVSLLSYPQIRDRLILLDGWSKTYAMTGWRIGFSVWPNELIEGAIRLAINCHSCVNAASQWGAIAALKGPQASVLDMIASFDERRRFLVEALNAIPGITCKDPVGAFYVFPNITGSGINSFTLQQELLEKAGVATIAGTSFGKFGEGYLRISYASPLQNIRLAIDRIKDYLSCCL